MTGANKCLFGGGKESCQKHRMYAFPGEKAQFCSNHKKPGMVDVHNKRCEAENCQKHPTYGLANGRARFCTKHKGPDMVDVHCRPCEHPGCSKHPHYAFEGDKARFCASHKEPGMVDVKHKRCHTAGCREMRVYETPAKKSRFCMVHLEEWLSAKTSRRAPTDRASAAVDVSSSKQCNSSSAAVAAVPSVTSAVNGIRGRPRISNNPFTPKMEYDGNGQGMMSGDVEDGAGSFLETESTGATFSSGNRIDNGRVRGVKRRVPPSKPRTPLRHTASGGFPDRAGSITIASSPTSPSTSMVKNSGRVMKHTGDISVVVANSNEHLLLSSPVSRIDSGRMSRDVGVGRNGQVSPVDVPGGGQQTLLPSPSPLSAEEFGLDPSATTGSIGGNGVDSRGRREASAEAGFLASDGMGSSPPSISYRRGNGNGGGGIVNGTGGGGNSPGGDTGGGFPRGGAKHELVAGVEESEMKRLRSSEAGVSMAINAAAVNGGGAGNGGYTKGEMLVYGQQHGEDHQQRQRQAGGAGISQHYQGPGVSQKEGVYSPAKGDRFSHLNSGIFQPTSSGVAGGGESGGERRRGRVDDEFGMPQRRDGDGAMVGQMPEGSESRDPSYGYADEDDVSSAPLPPLSKDSTSVVPKRGHRRHASFDPNTDCFPQQFSLVNGGTSGRGGQFPLIAGNDSHGYTGPVAGLGSGGGSFGGSFGAGTSNGGSFGGSSNGRRHVRGCSSGSVDLNVLAPVLAELRNSGGGSIGGAGGNASHLHQYPSLPPPRQPHQQALAPPSHAQAQHEHEHEHAHAASNDRGDHQYQQQQQQRQQQRHHGGGVALPVIAEPGTPPHILSDDAASAPSPKNTTTHNSSTNRAHDGHFVRGEADLFHQQQQQQGFRVDAIGRPRHYDEGTGEGGEEDYATAAHFYGGDGRQGGEHQHHDHRAQHLSGSGSPRWASPKPASALYMDGQGPPTVVSHHLDSGRELHPTEDMVHGDVSGSPRGDGSRVAKGAIWIRHPDGMTAGGGGGRRHFMQH